jgi:MFS family permease
MIVQNDIAESTGSGSGRGLDSEQQLGGLPPAARVSAGQARWALFLLTLVGALNYFHRTIFNVVLESIKSEMHLSDTSIGLLGGVAFVLCYSLLGVPVAYLADRFNRRNIIAIGLAFWSFMTVLTGMAINVWQLASTRFLMGAGESTGTAPSNSFVSDLYGNDRRAFVLGITSTGSGIGTALAYLIGGAMNQHYGWRSVFYVASIPGIVVAVLLLLTVREPARGAFDSVKAAAQTSSFRETLGFLFCSKTYVLVVSGGCMMSIAMYAILLWSAAFLMRIHKLSSGGAGAFVATATLPSLVGPILGGYLAGRLGRRDERWRAWIPALGCGLFAPAMACFVLSDSGAVSYAGLCVALFCVALHLAPVYALCLNVAQVRMRAVASAVFLLCANILGQTIGPLGVGYLTDKLTATMGSMAIRYSMATATSCAVAGGVLIWASARYVVQDTRRALEA